MATQLNFVAGATQGNDSLSGTAGNDVIVDSKGGNDTVAGGAGDDELLTASGNDLLMGGAGNDAYLGGSGNDILLDQGGGNDTYSFGAGLDNGIIDGADTLTDDNGSNDTVTLGVTADRVRFAFDARTGTVTVTLLDLNGRASADRLTVRNQVDPTLSAGKRMANVNQIDRYEDLNHVKIRPVLTSTAARLGQPSHGEGGPPSLLAAQAQVMVQMMSSFTSATGGALAASASDGAALLGPLGSVALAAPQA